MTTLEILYAARESIANPRTKWDFSDWTSCTCGHIYRAANGGRRAATCEAVAYDEQVKEKVRDAYKEIARVLNLRVSTYPPFGTYDAHAYAISEATVDRIPECNGDGIEREHALSLIDDAITALEAEYERNRLDVLAQAERIVDNADVREPVTA